LEYSKHLCNNEIIIVTSTVSTPTHKCVTDIVKVLVCAKQLSEACTYATATIQLLVNSIHTNAVQVPGRTSIIADKKRAKLLNERFYQYDVFLNPFFM
jgi:hypothetical protein